jgi:mannan polymerase II complex ANP1 subunit
MAKRMQYSVVGLPHYTIWHLYEPSVDDLRHMEEMEQEKKQREAKEKEEKAEAERQQKLKDRFKDSTDEWEKDGAEVKKKIDKTEQTQQVEKARKGQSKDAAEDLEADVENERRPAIPAKGEKEPAGAAAPKNSKPNTQKEKTRQDSSSNHNEKLE